MKKTIAMLLLTALCMTVLTSCDLGNGLVAELFGDLNHEDVLVEDVPVEDVILDDVILLPPEQWGTVEVETAPVEPGIDWEDYTYDVTVDIGVAYPDVLADFAIHTIEFERPSITESSSFNGTVFAVKYDLISLTFVGMATLYAGDCTVGYRISEECILDASFWDDGTDSEPEYRNLRIEIPADQLTDGYNEITLIYEMDGQIYEIVSVDVFKEVPTTEVEYPEPPIED